MALRITRGKECSLRISLPFPRITTVTPAGCCRTVRPGGMAIASRMTKVCDKGCCAATATYSMIAKNRAASLIGQLRTNSCPRLARTVIDQPPDQGFVHGTVPLRGADHFLDDDAVAIDQEALGHAGGLIRRLDGCRLVVQDVEAQPQRPRERHDHGIVLLVDAHRRYPEVAALPQPAVDPLHRGRSEEHTSELQSPCNLVCRLLLEKKKCKAHIVCRPGTSPIRFIHSGSSGTACGA